MTETSDLVATPDPATQAPYRITDEVFVMRAALGLPIECYACRLPFDLENITCRNHAEKSDQWAACENPGCGEPITRAACAASNGRREWFHIVPEKGTGINVLRMECDVPARPGHHPADELTEEQEAFLGAVTKTFTPAQRAQATELYLRLPAERRDGFLNRCRFVWTIVRAVMDETVGGR